MVPVPRWIKKWTRVLTIAFVSWIALWFAMWYVTGFSDWVAVSAQWDWWVRAEIVVAYYLIWRRLMTGGL